MKTKIYIHGDLSSGAHIKCNLHQYKAMREIHSGWVLLYASLKEAKQDLKRVFKKISSLDDNIRLNGLCLEYEGALAKINSNAKDEV